MPQNRPVVTGISPAEGPPGTKVKIRGENLGRNAEDLLGMYVFKIVPLWCIDIVTLFVITEIQIVYK